MEVASFILGATPLLIVSTRSFGLSFFLPFFLISPEVSLVFATRRCKGILCILLSFSRVELYSFTMLIIVKVKGMDRCYFIYISSLQIIFHIIHKVTEIKDSSKRS